MESNTEVTTSEAEYLAEHPGSIVDHSLGIPILGDPAFVARQLAAAKNLDIDPAERAGAPTEVDGIQATPMIQTDARYRAALRDDTIPDGVKRAIRQYFRKRNHEEMTSKIAGVHPVEKNFVGKKMPHTTDAVYKKPADMSARQFKKMKKARFREFRGAYKLATKAMTTLSASKAS